MKNMFFALLSAVLVSTTITAQTEAPSEKKNLTNGTVAEQLDYVESESNDFQEYKVIKKAWFTKLQTNINDSIARHKAATLAIAEQLKVEQLEKKDVLANLSLTRDTLADVRAAQSSMRWIGIPMEKTAYRTIMWSLVLLFGLIAVVAFVRFKASNSKTKMAQADLEKVQEEFEEHRKAALLREQKLRRELQDEINARRKREGA
jgi:CRISPR/Cas system CMR-associated protein Cmr5 small subunit